MIREYNALTEVRPKLDVLHGSKAQFGGLVTLAAIWNTRSRIQIRTFLSLILSRSRSRSLCTISLLFFILLYISVVPPYTLVV